MESGLGVIHRANVKYQAASVLEKLSTNEADVKYIDDKISVLGTHKMSL